MQFTGDYHIHSKYSDGKSTIEEIINAASDRKLKEVAITDHGPNNLFTGVKSSDTYLKIKEVVKNIAPKYPDVKVLVGSEANIIGLNGELDVDKEIRKKLDVFLVGLHPYIKPINFTAGIEYVLGNQWIKVNKGHKEKIKNINTKSLIEALYHNDCLAVTHPGLKMPVDLEELGSACIKTNTALEINCGHKSPNLDDIMKVAKTGVDFIVNSDSHFKETVGDLKYGKEIIDKLNISPECVINLSN